jgi:hypothetical protein
MYKGGSPENLANRQVEDAVAHKCSRTRKSLYY